MKIALITRMKNVFLHIIPIILFCRCTAPFEINTRNSEPLIVIYGCLTSENKYHSIRITRSSPYFHDDENEGITNAKVIVTSSLGLEYPFSGDSMGLYVSQRRFAASPGATYRLSVEVDNERYEAETTTLPVVPVDSIEVKYISIMGFGHYSLNVFMQEPGETENYYLFRYFINDTISNDMVTDFVISSDHFYNGEYVNGANITYFEDANDPLLQEFNRENDYQNKVSPGDKVRLHIINIEKGYYNFIRDCKREKHGENPFFGGPPSNIFTNLTNNAVGYFTSYCIQVKQTVVAEKTAKP